MKTFRDPIPALRTISPLEEIRDRVRDLMDPEGWAHVQRAAALARELAGLHGIDADRAEVAALLHDIADHYSDRELLQLAHRYDILVNLTEARVPRLIHGKVGAAILRYEWGITDEEILDAVAFHLSGAPQMGKLAKVIFVADKLEPHRDKYYGDLRSLREIARVDLDQAMLKLYAWRMNQLLLTGAPVHEDLADARNALIEETRATA